MSTHNITNAKMDVHINFTLQISWSSSTFFFYQKIDHQDFPRFFLSVSQDPIQVHPGSLFIAFYPPCPFLFRTHFPTLSKLKWTWKIPSTSLEPSPRHLSLALAVPTLALGPGVLCNRNWEKDQQEHDGFIREKSGLRQRKLSDYHQT